jgi:aminopeptidase N
MKDPQARTIFLKDYSPPPFNIQTTALHFKLFEDHAVIESSLLVSINTAVAEKQRETMVLDGQDMELLSIEINGVVLNSDQYLIEEESLTINDVAKFIDLNNPEPFLLRCHTKIEPQNNTTLEGLYKSKKMFCTQCEAEGFRRITYYFDRPDVMSVFTTTVEADRSKYPLLLSNGNNVASGVSEADSSRHWVTWQDPFKKPCYLFALVAGDLTCIDDTFTTMSGREVALKIFVEEKDVNKCEHAMTSLKNSMAWDEQIFGREYDLDVFMIVAVDDFNMGAMENKGLNIFNTSCVLANPKTQSDMAFQRVEAVVAHEYFHNWSGNRVTCRDWFQLSLKEGFTVFRDSEFSADMGSRTVKRVEDVSMLRTIQFAEDSGPMAHSVRPDSYMEIANFYTVTIYEKGAEVVRMIELLVGKKGFRKGSDLYFQRHDGQAVTTEEFVKAMEDANGVDLSQFRRWYYQAGTPIVEVTSAFDAATQQYTLNVKQRCPDTPGQTNKLAFHIPLRLGLIDLSGEQIELKLKGDNDEAKFDLVLDVKQAEQSFVFTGITTMPIPSLLRGFSAPVRLRYQYTHEELFFLMAHDADGFNRWNASQVLATQVIGQAAKDYRDGHELKLSAVLRDAYASILDAAIKDAQIDRAMVAQLLSLPVLGSLIEQSEQADVEALHGAREFLLNTIAVEFKSEFSALFSLLEEPSEYVADAQSIALRSLKNLCLSYLARTLDERWLNQCYDIFSCGDNMTNQSAALRMLVNNDSELGLSLSAKALDEFYAQWHHEPLVVDQWFVIQAMAQTEGALERVKSLMGHEAFAIRNPNKVRSLIGAFCAQNHLGFHHESGSGYEFLADMVLTLDKLNPQIASRLLTPLTRWKKYDSARQALMQAQLMRIKAQQGLSKDVFEIVAKSTVL